jgi:hypothetical protein
MKACSPLLQGVTDPTQVLLVVAAYPILCYSESSFVFYPLREKGWVEYVGGRWAITDTGREVLATAEPKEPEPPSAADFFGLG